jgi:hypothetical protein
MARQSQRNCFIFAGFRRFRSRRKTPIASARWRRSQIAETFASVRVSAPSYRFTENIGFISIVEPELKLVQIERQIFLADVMVGSDHATFQQRPKTFDALSVNVAAHVFARAVTNELMLAIVDADGVVGAEIVSDNQRCARLGYFANESGQSVGIDMLDHLADHVALARDCADDRHLAGSWTASSLDTVLAMAILVQPADIGFVYFYNAHQLPELRVFHSGAQTHAHIPSGLIGASSKHAMDLKCAYSFLRRDHQVQNLEPHNQRLLGFLENRSGRKRKAIGRTRLRTAFHTLPVPRTRSAFVNVIVVTTWALWASRPAAQEQISAACVLVREQRIELAERHLSHKTRLVLVCFRHASDISANARVSQEPDNSLLLFRRTKREEPNPPNPFP